MLEGETLWGIAVSYGVTMQAIRDMNGMPGDETIIYTGRKLLIKPAAAPPTATTRESTAAAQGEATSQAPTLTRTTTEAPTPSMTITPAPSNQESAPKNSVRTVLIVGLGLMGLGLVVFLILTLRRHSSPS